MVSEKRLPKGSEEKDVVRVLRWRLPLVLVLIMIF